MKDFIRKLFSSDDSVSSKRFFGAIGFMVIVAWVIIGNDLSDNNLELMKWLLVCCVGMLGLETIMNPFKK